MTDAPSPFSPNIPHFQTVWDSTSLGWYKTCPRLYQYQMLEGWEPRSRSVHLTFGGLYASGVERYAHHRASGLDHDTATRLMVRWVLENSGTRDEEGLWTPWDSSDHPDGNIKNRYTLVRTLVWNVEERQHSPFQTLILANGKPAVELSFTFDAFDIGGENVRLSGHLDEVVEADGDLWIRDDKTSKNQLNAAYFQQYTPNNQMSLYSIAGKIILDRPVRGVLIKAAQIGVNFSRFATAQVPRSPSTLAEWMADTELYITRAREDAMNGYWPMNDKACFLCSFKRICSVSPSHRKAHLEADFVVRRWNPNESRGDV